MILGLEIGLIITAWRRGWKAWSLLPLGVVVGIGFLIGLAIGASGASAGSVVAISIALDITCIGILIGMVVRPRKATQSVRPEQAKETGVVQRVYGTGSETKEF